jgi:trk system potassium uptake protein TrkA
MYLVIVGAGDIGMPLVEMATLGGNEVVVVESDESRAAGISGEYDCLVINADATSMETLEDAGADRADAIITTTDRDATNIMVCLLAQELEIPNVVSVVQNPEDRPIFERIGVNIMENPSRIIAEYLYRAVKRPSIQDYMRVGETAEVFEITVTENAPTVGKTLQEAHEEELIDDETLVVAIERESVEEPITPRGETQVKAGDLLVVYSGDGAIPEVTDVFGHYEDHNQVRRD